MLWKRLELNNVSGQGSTAHIRDIRMTLETGRMQGLCQRKANPRVWEERGWHARTGKGGYTRPWCGCVSLTVSETLNRMIHFQHWTPKEKWTKSESLLETGDSWISKGEWQLWRRGELEESMARLGLRAQVFGHRLLHYKGLCWVEEHPGRALPWKPQDQASAREDRRRAVNLLNQGTYAQRFVEWVLCQDRSDDPAVSWDENTEVYKEKWMTMRMEQGYTHPCNRRFLSCLPVPE